jgi:Protein of unknown function (DUF2804).
MPWRSHGAMRKRWRYVAVYGPEVMLCATRAQVGPFGQCFWALWDRKGDRLHAHTRMRPGGTEVVMRGPDIEVNSGGVRARLRFGDSVPVEAICPSGAGWGWTRKRAGMPVTGTIEAEGRRWEIEGHGVDDESAGYHRRHTSWHWSAGVGCAADGRPVAWNLVTGINDPPERSERAIWVAGVPVEPPPVSFRGTVGVEFPGGALLSFAAESERSREDNMLVLRSRYRHLFGTFSGSLDGIELAEGLGVMEEHEALW